MLQKAHSSEKLNPQEYYRMPWSLTDNGISWLEVTTKCNLACKGCYRDPKKEGHKSLSEIQEDLRVFKQFRKSDCMSIAGGDPLVHPQIVEIVKMIKAGGWKPILNTNGLALTPKLLTDLKMAGVAGFTFHIDTSQTRKDSKAETEAEHNALRQKFAEMVASVEGIACSFNQTVSEKTLHQIPETVKWAIERPHLVQTVVFILYREPSMVECFDFFANGKKTVSDQSYNNTDFCGDRILKTQDVVDQIRMVDPSYEPAGYLNGTVDPASMKWTLALRLASGSKTFGYAGGNFMKTAQHCSHFFRNKWLSYSSPSVLGMGRSTLFSGWLIDKGLRSAGFRYLKTVLKNPFRLFKKVHVQTFAIIQPIDILEDGQANMCDGCPDMTVYNGRLYWSCRLEEIKEYGVFATAYPKEKAVPVEAEFQVTCMTEEH